MKGDFLLDTNVVVYAFEPGVPAKKAVATTLMQEAANGRGGLSFQVVQEFISVAQKKFRPEIPFQELRKAVQDVLLPLCRFMPGPGFYLDAMDTQRITGGSWYDCLILQAAVDSRCDTLYSEDFQDGFQFRGVTVVNPFR